MSNIKIFPKYILIVLEDKHSNKNVLYINEWVIPNKKDIITILKNLEQQCIIDDIHQYPKIKVYTPNDYIEKVEQNSTTNTVSFSYFTKNNELIGRYIYELS